MELTLTQTAIFSVMDILQYYFFINKVTNKQLIFRKQDLVYMMAVAIPITWISYSFKSPYLYFFNLIMLMVLCYGLYRIRGVRLVYVHVIGVMCVLTWQLIILVGIGIVYHSPSYQFSTGLVAQSLGVLGAFSASKKLQLDLLLNFVDTHNKTFKVILANLFILMTASVVAWTLKFESFIYNIHLMTVFTAIIVLTNTILLKASLKNEVVEEQNRLYEQYIPIVDSLIDEVRAKQHDFDNHLMALRMMIGQEKDLGKAIEQLDDYIDELYGGFKERELVRIENKVVAGFLYSKIKQAESLNIQFEINLEDTEIATTLKNFELLEVFSILIDNAFETGVADNHVKIHIKKEKYRSVIEVLNKHPYISTDQFQKIFTHGYSSKGEKNRGIGLHKLQQILNKASGELVVANCQLNENYVAFKVILP